VAAVVVVVFEMERKSFFFRRCVLKINQIAVTVTRVAFNTASL